MDLGLHDKVAVVTGASKGIGLAIVTALAHEGAQVIAGARHSSIALDDLARTAAVEVVAVDLSERTGPAQLVVAAGAHLDILVNNVGGARTRVDGFLAVTDDEWQRSLELNFLAAVRATRSALPLMITNGGGAIVNVASVNSFLPDPAVIDYGAAKAALANFSKALSKEVGAHGVRINTVSPGPVATDLWLGDRGVAATVSAATGMKAEDVAAQAVAGTATGRFTQPREVADLVLLLASDRTANVTGSNITVDGGLVTTL